MNSHENALSLNAHKSDECQIYSLDAADFGACLNIGDRRMSDIALALLDCRLTSDGRDPSRCMLSTDGRMIQCPKQKSGVSGYDVFDVLLELFDACHPRSLEFFRDKSTLLSSELAYLTRESVLHYSKAREDFDIVVKQTNRLNLLLQDNVLIGKELLEQTDSATRLSFDVKKLLMDFKESSMKTEVDLDQAAKEIMSQWLSSLKTESVTNWDQTSSDAKSIIAIDDGNFGEMIYCSFCRCMFVFFMSKALGIIVGAFFILTILIAVQSMLSNQKPLHVIVETVLNQFFLLSLFLVKGTYKKIRNETHSTTQTSQVSM